MSSYSKRGSSDDRRVVLASASPRRRELMSRLNVVFEVTPPAGDESPRREDEAPEQYARRLSRDKAREVAWGSVDGVVVAADTIVVIDHDVLGKPVDASEARDMLLRLRGRTHQVTTGVTTIDAGSGETLTSSKTSEVVMRGYSDAEIDTYVASGEPFDKAGAYGVQDEAFHPTEDVYGCYVNVVGLPVCEVVTLLGRLGVEVAFGPGWAPSGDCPDCGRIPRRKRVAV